MKLSRKIGALLLAASMTLSSGCIVRTSSRPGTADVDETSSATAGASADNSTDDGGTNVPVIDSGDFGDGRSTMLNLNGDALEISRRTRSTEQDMGDSGVWTIFVYMCGTDLEAYQGSATEDLEEMIDGVSENNVRFVVETDGTSEWYNNTVEGETKQRFVIDEYGIEEVYSGSSTNMGSSSTLEDFLRWGVEEYASQRMGVILWNHGSGSISGVCFDENFDCDSLTVREMETALTEIYGDMTCRFDFFGFDACLMSTVEVANMLAPHAEYMYASQELESGYGWDYEAIGEYLSKNGVSADGAALGKEVCDSFMKSCERSGEEDESTLACIDLSKLDIALVEFNSYIADLYSYCSNDNVKFASVIRAIKSAESYGGNNDTEGYTNMVDMGCIITNTAEATGISGTKAVQALDDCVTYSVKGAYLPDGHGLSIYYPLSVEGSYELDIFKDICVSPYYLSFVDLVAYSGNNAGSVDDYDDSDWFGDGSWFWNDDDYSSDYWDDGYSDENYNFDVDSSALSYLIAPHLSEDGMYQFTLTEDSLVYLDAVYCNVLISMYNEDGDEVMLDLGTDDYVTIDWNTGFVEDNFDGYWFALPDGQPLAAFLIEQTYDYNIYSAPIYLNDEYTYLRIRLDYLPDGYTITMTGTWDGIDENGSASREVRELQAGDRICPCYDAYYAETGYYYDYYYGDEWVYDGTATVDEALLSAGEYYYCFEIYDIFGTALYTDFVLFGVEENGDLYFYEDSYGGDSDYSYDYDYGYDEWGWDDYDW